MREMLDLGNQEPGSWQSATPGVPWVGEGEQGGLLDRCREGQARLEPVSGHKFPTSRKPEERMRERRREVRACSGPKGGFLRPMGSWAEAGVGRGSAGAPGGRLANYSAEVWRRAWPE